MADVDVDNPGDSDVVSAFAANERASRAAILALLAGDAFGGGDMGGSANAHTLTVANTGVTLTDGMIVWGVAVATNTSACTLQVNSLTAKSLWLPNGTAISSSHAGAVTSGRVYTFQYHASDDVFYVLNASGYMDQTLYDQLYPIGASKLHGAATTPGVPFGVTATWSLETGEGLYLRMTTGTPISVGGSLTTGSEGAHTHTFTTSGNSTATGTEVGADFGAANDGHTHTGTTSAGSAHTHSIEPSYVTYRVYRRTA